MADGRLGKCKTCTKNDVKKRYQSPIGRKKVAAYEKARNKTAHRKFQKSQYNRKAGENKPGTMSARYAVRNAIRNGRLIRLPCEKCGNKKSEAHHDDYRKKLDVRWLCFRHHREAHGQKVSQEA
jgi:hypothetical protein